MVATIARFLFRRATALLLVAVGVVCGAYHVARPTEPTLTDRQHALVDELAEQVTAWARELEPVREPTAFLTLGRDRFGRVSDRVRTVLWQSDRFELADYALREKVARQTHWTRPTVANRAEAVERARALGCDYVLWGKVNELSDVGDAARLAVDLELVRARGRETVAARSFDVRHGAAAAAAPAPPPARGPSSLHPAGWSVPTRLLVWAVVTAALPLASYPLAKRVLVEERHAATLALLAGYVAASVLLAYGLVVQAHSGWVAGFVLLASFGLACLYNWHALSAIKTVSH